MALISLLLSLSTGMRVALHHGRACEGEDLDITCASNRQLNIKIARFGAAPTSICNGGGGRRSSDRGSSTDGSLLCESTRALQKVRER